MLDVDTKRRIDTARDILVGKVPDPKSQVELITIALIYKFMDDMDAEAEEMGGKRKFFAGGFARYGWAKLMRSGLGGHETLNLYAEAIAKMPENSGIPPLFRDIFKNAYLPYRDPETLRAFLKIIDEFTYDHSERLGDAFEYLLSVLGSQGDAGQFRTPRHIIDFIVAIIDPKKTDTVLDPACGTAGFLISAYKHILRANCGFLIEDCGLETQIHDQQSPIQNLLTPDERGRLAANFKGYDISPDMVRLSLVNLYLHGFADPHIVEYDTLTSQERWNEYADVILANPPFMSPKGGIKPHNRFSVQSKRSEVLFVDYMAEHLKSQGRAGIIVPEGIIFQSQTAYTQLRKMLVEDYLVAVVSLPAGVFNPYSGVKTSILILDKALAKRTNAIAFFKIENDGFGLGAQRREIDKNDLPAAIAFLKSWFANPRVEIHNQQSLIQNALIVPKEKIAANGDYNLSAERYRDNGRLSQAKWPVVSLSEFCSFMTGGTPASTVPEYYEGGTVPWLVSGDIHKGEIRDCERRITEKGVENSNARYLPENSVLIALNGQGKTRGTVAMLRMKATCNQSLVAITPTDPIRAVSEYVYWALRSMYEDIRALTGDNERSGLSITILKTIRIPLPPLEVQKEIVAEIKGYQKVIDGARAVLDNYCPHIPIHPDWPMVALGKVARLINGRAYKQEELLREGPTPVLRVGNFFSNRDWYYSDLELEEEKYCNKGDLLYAWSASFGPRIWKGPRAIFHYHIWKIETTDAIDKRFLFHLLAADSEKIKAEGHGIAMMHATKGGMEARVFPLPPLPTQQAIIAEIEAEQALVAASRELIARMEKKIQATLARVWGEELGEEPSVCTR